MHHVILHIGTHKTGTTSFQHWLEHDPIPQSAQDVRVYPYEGALKISAACIRDECDDIPPLYGQQDWQERRAQLHEECKQEVSKFLGATQPVTLIISCEHLSFFRTDEECAQLRGIFPEGTTFSILLVLREKKDFLRSYRKQVIKISASRLTYVKTSPYYCLPGTWLTDFEAIIAQFKKEFGAITVLDYDPKDMISQLVAAAGLSWNVPAQSTRENLRKDSWRNVLIEMLYQVGVFDVVKAVTHWVRRVRSSG